MRWAGSSTRTWSRSSPRCRGRPVVLRHGAGRGRTLGAVCGQLQGRGSRRTELDLETWQASLGTACQAARAAERPLSHSEAEVPDSRPEPGRQRPGARAAPRRGGPRYVRHVVELVRQVAEAAHALHEAGVIHRDIKPDNIMVEARRVAGGADGPGPGPAGRRVRGPADPHPAVRRHAALRQPRAGLVACRWTAAATSTAWGRRSGSC